MKLKINSIKTIAILLLAVLFSNSIYAQAGKKADKDTELWRYEIQCGGVGVQGTKLVKVFSYSKNPDVAIEQAKKNAVHGMIFQGFIGSSLQGCETQKPLTDNPALEQEKSDFFKAFFADGGKYMKFVSVSGDGSVAAEDRMKVGKEYKVGVLVSVLYENLRKDLEAAGIIQALQAPGGAAPTVMFFPSDVWMKGKNYITVTDNQGKKTEQNDYDAAVKDPEFSAILSTLNTMMNERGLRATNLADVLAEIKNSNASENMAQNEEGGGVAESASDKLLKVARPDIRINVTWTLTTSGPKKSVHFQLDGVDAGTSKSAGSASGDSKESLNGTVYVLLKEAVLNHIDNFNSQLMSYFQNITKEGKEINLEVRVWDTSPKKLNSEINEDGDELKDDLKKWVSKNSVGNKFNLGTSSPNMMNFTGIRIPVKNEDGSANDADAFAAKLRKYLKKTYQLPSASSAIGLGKGVVIIGGKSQ